MSYSCKYCGDVIMEDDIDYCPKCKREHCVLTDQELIDHCEFLINDFCKNGFKSGEWTMRIPAEPNRDPDLVFSELIKRYKSLSDRLISNHKKYVEKIEVLREKITNNDCILLSEDEHDIIKYIDRHILNCD